MPSWKSCASARTKKKPSPEKGPFSVDGKQFTQFFVPARRYVRDFAQVRENRSLHPSTSGPDRDAQAVLAGPILEVLRSPFRVSKPVAITSPACPKALCR